MLSWIALPMLLSVAGAAAPRVAEADLDAVPSDELRQLEELVGVLDALDAEIESAKRIVDDARDGRGLEKEGLATSRLERDTSKDEVAATKSDAAASVAHAKDELVELEATERRTRDEYRASKVALKAAKIQGDRNEVGVAKATVSSSKASWKLAKAEAKRAGSALREAKADGKAAVASAKDAHHEANAEVAAHREQVGAARSGVDAARLQLEVLRARRDAVEAELERARAELAVRHGAEVDLGPFTEALDAARGHLAKVEGELARVEQQ